MKLASAVVLTPARAVGTLEAPPSKSVAHRALIAAGLAGESTVRGVSASQDMEATLRCLRALGCVFERQGDTVRFFSPPPWEESSPVTADCGESGSTLRFLLPVFAAYGRRAVFTGEGRLPSRPLSVYERCLPPHGVTYRKPDISGGIAAIEGRLTGGEVAVAGDISSQFVTGLLLALPLCPRGSVLRLTSPLQSRDYVGITLSALRRARVVVRQTASGFEIPPAQRFSPCEIAVEGDWSQAAFPLVAGAIGGDVTVEGVSACSAQGDRRVADILAEMGADMACGENTVRARKAPLHGIHADASDIPDLVPPLSIAAAAAVGETVFTGVSRLRLKESDRLRTTVSMLRALGVRAFAGEDSLTVCGRGTIPGGRVDGAGDHRIVMSAAIARYAAQGNVTVSGARSVEKSWPDFFEEMGKITG